jgi:hypothetical protein
VLRLAENIVLATRRYRAAIHPDPVLFFEQRSLHAHREASPAAIAEIGKGAVARDALT